jgi:hypothetical protein
VTVIVCELITESNGSAVREGDEGRKRSVGNGHWTCQHRIIRTVRERGVEDAILGQYHDPFISLHDKH